MTSPLILAFDTSGPYCAAALLSGRRILSTKVDEMARGQAEHLFPLLEALLADKNINWQELTAIGVGVGPGNFTGIRISVAAARGLALSLGIPARGISSLEAQFTGSPLIAQVPAPRQQSYIQMFSPQDEPPQLVTHSEAENLSSKRGIPLGAPLSPQDLVSVIATRVAQGLGATPPAPLYVRSADAAPPKDPAPVILP